MITRADYMANSKTLYRPYYLELATAAGIDLSADLPLINRCRDALKAGDVHLYAVPLGSWDARALALQGPISRAMKERGDTWSIAGGVCVLKEAARAAAEAPPKGE
jgi:hypothetical protein